ncbi:hypothetical protein BAUCODRAFT_311457 [Baudoinia panamericana UAMH 10762]|uniref:Uncharacterized protein n=1 Tax=Baudoinia panamericana (strain UAMH 10762) TaxID=717646 RepID=M2MZ18_BAUPA|nr:uncharacterized protein BAUCODRAFT_311457 [Baudoinia panamericana UAMH 10762]EMC91929.1 hypothetical protein BAUCODRAFT_311457 [Baudoinia panamericana UAMH 10762]
MGSRCTRLSQHRLVDDVSCFFGDSTASIGGSQPVFRLQPLGSHWCYPCICLPTLTGKSVIRDLKITSTMLRFCTT